MDFLKKAEGALKNTGSSNQTGQQGAVQGQGQAVGNNQNEDYGDKGLCTFLSWTLFSQMLTSIQKDSTSWRRRLDTRWAETRTRRSPMVHEACMRRLLGTSPSDHFLFHSSYACRRGYDNGNLILCCVVASLWMPSIRTDELWFAGRLSIQSGRTRPFRLQDLVQWSLILDGKDRIMG